MKLLDEKSFTDFNKHSGLYNANVYKNSRIIHKKNGCYYCKPSQFIPFNSLQEIKEFEHRYDVQFTYCQNKKCGFKN